MKDVGQPLIRNVNNLPPCQVWGKHLLSAGNELGENVSLVIIIERSVSSATQLVSDHDNNLGKCIFFLVNKILS